MLSPGMDSAREGGGVAGTVLIPMNFVWSYGGRSVYLSGSFTGWTNLYQMSPVEGCPTVFQVICSLTPGYHQYKFFVDGEWRHDENQPFISCTYGIVNTVLLARESDYIPPTISPAVPSLTNMDVDNEAFQQLVRISDGSRHEAVPRIQETDLEVSRHRVSLFLSTHTVYELLPESGKVITLDVDLPVKQAFHILYEQVYFLFLLKKKQRADKASNSSRCSLQGISIAPLWDYFKGRFVGVLSALDFILILRELGNHGSNLTEEELETHTISAWKEGKGYLNRQIDGNGRAFSRGLIHVSVLWPV
ncbi:Sucrose nonfermenting 4-like protein [Vitis vinifera]|uniref:Sucrose nonfermenting 4-like protein n=1 Tax=Vitis vinifera TaxID=29760 RepID=A0A438KLI8_VITVI|nr:Sucrose nonfermenting 4-like protein [Vitis vinifera]